jgi:hypothetical protein
VLLQPLQFTFIRTAVAAVLLAIALQSSALAVLQVYEGFQYADTTTILGQNGGGGWSTSWTAGGTITGSTENATTPGLTYSTLPALGNKLTIAGQQTTNNNNANNAFLFRNFGATTSYGADGTTAWISLIGQRTGLKSGTHGAGATPSYQRIFGVSFFSAGTANTNERFNIGELTSSTAIADADMWALNIFNPTGTGEVQSSTTPIDQLSFLLVRLDYGTGLLADNAYLWVNPNLSLGEPSIGSANASLIGRNLEFDRLRVSAGGSNSSTEQPNGAILAASGLLDEIRIGTNFSSVIGPGLIPGDVNGDLLVNSDDYDVIRDHFQMTNAARTNGDLNADGSVNFADFRIWKNNKTSGAGTAEGLTGGAAPEPSSFVLVAMGMFVLGGRRFSRRQPIVCTSSGME